MTLPSIDSVHFGRMAPCLGVRDIQAALAFYSSVFGFQKVFENGDPVGFMVLKKDTAELQLSHCRDHQPPRFNAAHLFVDNIDMLYARCAAAQVRILKGLRDKDYGQRAFVFADPDGNRIDVGERIR